ncbi:MAG: hypothetical protein GXO28_04765 [Methanopyri archaeon]|nr:hypothetical protein [Methanopyri archaeon]
MKSPVLEVPVDPTPAFGRAAARHAAETLSEHGLDPETARGLVGTDPLPEGSPEELLREGLRGLVEGISDLLDPDGLREDLEALGGSEPVVLADAVSWRVKVGITVLEAVENLLSPPHLADALDLWAAGLALRTGNLAVATSVLSSLGWRPDAPVPRVYVRPPHLSEVLTSLGDALIGLSLAAHALSSRGASPSVVARALPRVEVPEADVSVVKPLLDAVRDVISRVLEEEARKAVWRGSEPAGLASLGVEDPEGFFRDVSDAVTATLETALRVVGSLDPGDLAGFLTRASTEVELAGEVFGPDSYDPGWRLWREARDALERELGVLDSSVEEALRRAIESVSAGEGSVEEVLGRVGEFLETGREIVNRAVERIYRWMGWEEEDRR